MALVHRSGSGTEAVPDGFAVLLVHRTEFFPLFVVFLEGPERLDHILLIHQGFCLLAEFHLGLEVLLEVEIPKFPVDLHIVVEHLHVVLVGIVEILDLALRHGTCGTPAVLDVAECREGVLEVFLGVQQRLELFDQGCLYGVVLFTLLFQLGRVLRTDGAILAVEFLETALDLCERIDGDRLRSGFCRLGRRFFRRPFRTGCTVYDRSLVTGCDLLLAEVLVEAGFQYLCLLA